MTAPPKGVDGYRERAAASAETIRSQVQLARIWVASLEEDESTKAAARVGLEETDRDAASAISTFEAYEVPAALNDLHSAFGSLAGSATDALAALRIAAEQERWEELAGLARPLPSLAHRLRQFEERAEP